MGLDYFTGFEAGVLPSVIGTEVSGGTATVQGTTVKTGAYALALDSVTGNSYARASFSTTVAAAGDLYIAGAFLRTDDLASWANDAFMAIGDGGRYVNMKVTTAGALDFNRASSPQSGGTTLGSSAGGVILVDTWHYIEMKVKFDNTTGSLQVWVDGTSVTNQTNIDTVTSGSVLTTREVWFLSPDHISSPYPTLWVDDVYFLDPTGEAAPFNDALGPIAVERLVPDGDSLTTNWTSSGANHWGVTDEEPVSGSDYTESSTTSSDLRMTMTNRALSGTIISVKPHAFAQIPSGTGPRSLAAWVRSDPGGTPTDSSKTGQALSVGTDKEIYSIVNDDPDTAADWTDGGINGAEVGLTITT